MAENAPTDAEPIAESSAMALAAKDEAAAPAGRKRRRSTEPEDDEDLLEIDVEAPEPLSKAEARAARKRAKKGLPEAPRKAKKLDEPKGDGAEEEEGKGEKKAYTKKQNSIWIGNLAFKTTAETLKAFLEKGVTELGGDGEGSVTRINLPTKPGKGQFAAGNKG